MPRFKCQMKANIDKGAPAIGVKRPADVHLVQVIGGIPLPGFHQLGHTGTITARRCTEQADLGLPEGGMLIPSLGGEVMDIADHMAADEPTGALDSHTTLEIIIPGIEDLNSSSYLGIVRAVFVQPGDAVKKDQVLAEIRVVPDQALLNEGHNRLKRAKVNLMEAERKLGRRKFLRDNKCSSISEEDFEKSRFEYELAKIDFKGAENNLQIIKEGGFGLEDEKNQTLLRATISGMVLDVPVKVGDTVIESNAFNEGTTIATVSDMRSLIFEGVIDESDVGKVAHDMQLQLQLGAIQNRSIQAVLTYIAPKGNSEKEGQVQFKIKAEIRPDPDLFIRAGYSANAQIVLAEKRRFVHR